MDQFRIATGAFTPYGWQVQVAVDGLPDVLPVSRGLGKTEVALTWVWRLLVDEKPKPLHRVFCLPMRSLATQTVQRLGIYFDALKAMKPESDVAVHQLMGGAIEDKWVGHVDKPLVLVGSQGQLLSRALNRGYAHHRGYPAAMAIENRKTRIALRLAKRGDELLQLDSPGATPVTGGA